MPAYPMQPACGGRARQGGREGGQGRQTEEGPNQVPAIGTPISGQKERGLCLLAGLSHFYSD